MNSSGSIDKQLVQRRFTNALHTYDKEATVQQQIVTRMEELLPASLPSGAIFEVGCGTGFLSRILAKHYPSHPLLLNDLCPEVEESLELYSEFIPGDAEHLSWNNGLAMVASSSCIQWWHRPMSFFPKAYDSLTSNGILLFSTFGPEQMHELKALLPSATLSYDSLSTLQESLENAGFKNICIYQERTTLFFDSFLMLLKHLKQTGVNGIRQEDSLTPGRIKEIEQLYRKTFSSEEHNFNLPLTYHAVWGRAEKI
ncbi:MAG: methyltransferase domain-containing protein [Porphyromonas sp.]|nr:methyltransferase domain-containing protein [Porphyromonas sp.]